MEVTLLGLDGLQLAAIAVVVVAGAVVQGSIGIGFGIVLVPALAVAAPAALPATPLMLALPLTALTARRERGAIDRSGFPLLLLGRVAGTALAVLLLLALHESALEILFGSVILGVVALSLARPRVPFTPVSRLVAGAASGLFATAAAIGGPPAALLYQQRPGPEVRATLGLLFLFGTVISIGALGIAGRLALDHLVLAVLLLPAMVIGFALSKPVARILDAGALRAAVLVFAAAGGLFAVVRGIIG